MKSWLWVNNKTLKNNKGTSFTEMMIVVALMMFMCLALLSILSVAKSAWYVADVQTDIYQNARKAMQEMFIELIEASSGNVETFAFTDPINGEYVQAIWFASPRGSNLIGGEDGSANNNYVHLDVDNVASWRSLIIYCAYENSAGIKQLRRYDDFGSSGTYYSQANIFPLTLLSATTTTLNFLEADGLTVISIDRRQGRVLANYLGNEDADNDTVLDSNEDDTDTSIPIDNGDGILNFGANFVKNVGSIDIVLFLAKEAKNSNQSNRILCTTLRNTVKFRQP